MIIACPNCGARFNIDETLLSPNGRKVRCANCAHAWRQTSPEPAVQVSAPVESGPAVSAAAPPPEEALPSGFRDRLNVGFDRPGPDPDPESAESEPFDPDSIMGGAEQPGSAEAGPSEADSTGSDFDASDDPLADLWGDEPAKEDAPSATIAELNDAPGDNFLAELTGATNDAASRDAETDAVTGSADKPDGVGEGDPFAMFGKSLDDSTDADAEVETGAGRAAPAATDPDQAELDRLFDGDTEDGGFLVADAFDGDDGDRNPSTRLTEDEVFGVVEAATAERESAARPRRSRGAALTIGFAGFLVGGLLAGLVLARDRVLEYADWMAPVYVHAGVGLCLTGHGLRIPVEEIRQQTAIEGDASVFTLSGVIRNATRKAVEVPEWQVRLTDAFGETVSEWVFRADAAVLFAGGETTFRTSVVNAPRFEDIAIEHVPPQRFIDTVRRGIGMAPPDC